MKISDMLVQDGEKHDDVLHRKLFPVNMRLFRTDRDYRAVIHSVVDLMERVLYKKFNDYNELRGISGANVGIPFNIVMVKQGDDYITMLNPEIISRTKKTKDVLSNCGSLNLKQRISVKRNGEIVVSYYLLDGPDKLVEETFKSSTVQHEIDHNNGILITDK